MTSNDILCSGDTAILIKAIRSFVDASPPTPFGSGPCGWGEGRAELVCAVWGCPTMLSPALAWSGLGSLIPAALISWGRFGGDPASPQHKGNEVSLEVMPYDFSLYIFQIMYCITA